MNLVSASAIVGTITLVRFILPVHNDPISPLPDVFNLIPNFCPSCNTVAPVPFELFVKKFDTVFVSVSYTHLTLPTNREV